MEIRKAGTKEKSSHDCLNCSSGRPSPWGRYDPRYWMNYQTDLADTNIIQTLPADGKNTIIINIIFYYNIRDGKTYNEIQLTKKIHLNNRKMKNNPISPKGKN